MSEWWTYSLHDLLLFAPETYYRLFALNNAAVWPAPLVALALGLGILFCVWRPSPMRSRLVAAVLALPWAWVAWTYHHQQYASINLAADYYAALFALEAMLLLVVGAGLG